MPYCGMRRICFDKAGYPIRLVLISMCLFVYTSHVLANDPDERVDLFSVLKASYEEKLYLERLEESQKLAYENDVVANFLRLVEQYEANVDNCSAGTQHNLGDGVVQQYGVLRFKQQAMVAVNRANLLTRIWKHASPGILESEELYYAQVVNIVEGDDDIFAGGNCYDYKQFKEYYLFCPYAYRLPNNSGIMVKDLSVEYKYLGNDSEWFYQARQNAIKKIQTANITLGKRMMRYNGTVHGPVEDDDIISVNYEDGHWSRPYFDCGGGNIWMMTYTVPFFGFTNNSYIFKGTSGIDIDLQKVDINQCPLPEGTTEQNVFANSSRCKPTTQCEPLSGQGFRRGNYKCVCQKGFYFPNVTAVNKYYDGILIENEYEKKMKSQENIYDVDFSCLPCSPDCDECIDYSPCAIQLNWVLRTCLLVLACVIMCGIIFIAIFVWRYKDVKVLKAASPLLLCIILLGALLLYMPIIVSYFEVSEISCSLRVWFREIGFSITFGALLLKTWRISVVFRVRSARRVKISDTDLIKRLALVVAVFVGYLTARMAVGRPQVITGRHSSGLKAYQCAFDVWDYCAAGGELLFLLWGIRLCIVVRKAPSEFNESRFISWAIYNETLLSVFLTVTMFFLQSPANPDLLYIVLFVHTQLTTTVTLAFLFGSKAYLVYKYKDKDGNTTLNNKGSTKFISRNTANTNMSSNSNVESEKFLNNFDTGGSTMEKDIQEEFKRLYMQLELLKQRNMKIGNRHLSEKLTAMTEVMHDETSSLPSSNNTSPPMNGRRVVISFGSQDQATNL